MVDAGRSGMSGVKLGPTRRWGVYVVAGGLWASGALWLVAHYFWLRQGEYGPETSPAEPWSLKIHGGFAMASLWMAGLLWGVHVLRGWRSRRGRWSGGTLLASVSLLAVSGYLLYYLGDETLRADASIAHWAIGLVVLPQFLLHRLLPKPQRATVRPNGRAGRLGT